jgi:hypothetical protein
MRSGRSGRDDRLGDGDDLAAGVAAALGDDAVALDLEEARQEAQLAAGEELEARLRGVVGVAARFALLDVVEDAGEAGVA